MKKLKIALAIISLCCLFAFVACNDSNADSAELPNVNGSGSDEPTPPNTEPDEPNSPKPNEIRRILIDGGYSVWSRNLSDVTDAEVKLLIKEYGCTDLLNAQKGVYVYNSKLNLYVEVYTYSISVFWFESGAKAQKAYEYGLKEYAKFNETPPEEMADYFYLKGNVVAFGSLETIAFVKAAVEQAE